MQGTKTLSRPLARRVADLAKPPPPQTDGPAVPAHVTEAASAALARGETHYTDRPGIPEFRQWVAEHLERRYGLSIDPSEVTITCGSTEARFVTMTLLAEKGRAVLCPGDDSLIRGPMRLAGARPRKATDGPDDISLLYLRPDDNPGDLEALPRMAESQDWWIVYDLSFSTPQSDFHPGRNPKLASRVVTIGSLSQALPGWRIGWMAGSEAALRLRAGKQAITICTTAVSQWAGLAYLRARSS